MWLLHTLATGVYKGLHKLYTKVNHTGIYSWSGQFALTTFQTYMNPHALFYSLWQDYIHGILICIQGYAANRYLTSLVPISCTQMQ